MTSIQGRCVGLCAQFSFLGVGEIRRPSLFWDNECIACPSHLSAHSARGGPGSASSVLNLGLGLELVPAESEKVGSPGCMK